MGEPIKLIFKLLFGKIIKLIKNMGVARTLKQLKSIIAFELMGLPMRGRWRSKLAKLGGVNVDNQAFIGKDVTFDTLFPEKIYLGKNVHLTKGCVLLTHYFDTTRDGIHFTSGTIEIGENTFIGINTVISKSVKIGKNVIIGAGSVVTKDIPDNEIWAGNPAKLIRKRQYHRYL